MAAEMGTTEKAYRRWVRSLGRLSERQEAQAQAIYVMAAQLDAIRDGIARGEPVLSGSSAAIFRALRLASGDMRDVQRLPEEPGTPAPSDDTVDEVAKARTRRLHGGRTAG